MKGLLMCDGMLFFFFPFSFQYIYVTVGADRSIGTLLHSSFVSFKQKRGAPFNDERSISSQSISRFAQKTIVIL